MAFDRCETSADQGGGDELKEAGIPVTLELEEERLVRDRMKRRNPDCVDVSLDGTSFGYRVVTEDASEQCCQPVLTAMKADVSRSGAHSDHAHESYADVPDAPATLTVPVVSSHLGTTRETRGATRRTAATTRIMKRHISEREVAGDVQASDTTSEPPQPIKISWSSSIRITMFIRRIRNLVHRRRERVARKVGVVLFFFTLVHIAALVFELRAYLGSRTINATQALRSDTTAGLSNACVLLHIIVMVPTGSSYLVWVHFACHAADSAIRGVYFLKVVDNRAWASYHLLLWSLGLWPACAVVLRKLFRAIAAFSVITRNEASTAALVAFAAAFPTGVYLTLNSAMCLAFVDDPLEFCGTRVKMNCAIMTSLAASSWVPAMAVLTPISFEQLTSLDLLPSQWVAALFYTIAYVGTVSLLSFTERFERPTVTVIFLAQSVSVSSVGAMMSVGFGVAQHVQADDTANVLNNHKTATTTKYGALAPWRRAMFTFTLVDVAVACSLPSHWQSVTFPLSFACSIFHFWISAEHELCLWPIVHFMVHMMSLGPYAYRMIQSRDYALVARMATYSFLCYPLVGRAAFAVRRQARENKAGTALTAASFCVLWTVVIPTSLYFSIDSAGRARFAGPMVVGICDGFQLAMLCIPLRRMLVDSADEQLVAGAVLQRKSQRKLGRSTPVRSRGIVWRCPIRREFRP